MNPTERGGGQQLEEVDEEGEEREECVEEEQEEEGLSGHSTQEVADFLVQQPADRGLGVSGVEHQRLLSELSVTANQQAVTGSRVQLLDDSPSLLDLNLCATQPSSR